MPWIYRRLTQASRLAAIAVFGAAAIATSTGLAADILSLSGAARSAPAPVRRTSSLDIEPLAPEVKLGAAGPTPVQASVSAQTPTSQKPRPRFQSIDFAGLRPGQATLEDLVRVFGQPIEPLAGEPSETPTFNAAKLGRVTPNMRDGRVQSLTLELTRPVTREEAERRFNLTVLRPLAVNEDSGRPVGICYPEHGVLLGLHADGNSVSHVLFEGIDPMAFAMRAETLLHSAESACLTDANIALELQPNMSRAQWLRARVLLQTGQIADALEAAEQAVAAEPNNIAYRLTWTEIGAAAGDREIATDVLEQILSDEELADDLKAQAQVQLGEVAGDGPDADPNRSLEHHLSAVKTAQPLKTHASYVVRREAKLVLLRAHLGAAKAVAAGHWSRKEAAVQRWLEKADRIAKDLVAQEGADRVWNLYAAQGALAAYAVMPNHASLTSWIERARSVADEAASGPNDSSNPPQEQSDALHRQRLDWMLGCTLAVAADIEHGRGESPLAMEYAQAAVKLLGSGGKLRQQNAADACLLGQVCFRIGLIHAKDQNDHLAAQRWYAKAVKLMDHESIPTNHAAIARGNAFVSMGVSYWETDQQDKAIALTERGAQLLSAAASSRHLDESHLTVPYGNLASMHRYMGHADRAESFARLASQYEPQTMQAGFQTPAEAETPAQSATPATSSP